MIDKDKLPKDEREHIEKNAALVRRYFDEAHLLADELHLTASDIFIVAIILAIIDGR